MNNLQCHISLLHDDVVTPIIEGAINSQLVVEQVVEAKAQELVSVGHFPVYLNFHAPPPTIIIIKDMTIQKTSTMLCQAAAL